MDIPNGMRELTQEEREFIDKYINSISIDAEEYKKYLDKKQESEELFKNFTPEQLERLKQSL